MPSDHVVTTWNQQESPEPPVTIWKHLSTDLEGDVPGDARSFSEELCEVDRGENHPGGGAGLDWWTVVGKTK